MTAQQYRKKPVVIEAVQYRGDNAEDIVAWVESGEARGFTHAATHEGQLHVVTLEGTMTVALGDYVIRGVQGEHYPCKPDIFDQTYDPA